MWGDLHLFQKFTLAIFNWEHYARPKQTTQTFELLFSAVWLQNELPPSIHMSCHHGVGFGFSQTTYRVKVEGAELGSTNNALYFIKTDVVEFLAILCDLFGIVK